ncbi:MAG: 4-hydroxy-tetrahydrodipicolinate reductase [Candidatus Improbicoccus pseudotrichonymphae]|uniref:4-hydroxy-tetrahydrodipicolinate reductase n=1 Tax=Candidatus Improbicoccus pseudotrichonymphae TaxID=3033792 RepID=A0AA48IH19_9FIRM|nr:MAG: 4-hydroxy-tetrahydrodipicolinate reductase [Candidatus Improbicoccus pseudotrichonymphae]
MIKLIVCGIYGRMGHAIVDVVKNDFLNCEVVGGIVKEKEERQIDVPVFTSQDEINIDWDAIIDVSAPETLDFLLSLDSYKNKKLIIGTTGYTERQKSKIEDLALTSQVRYVPNASILFNSTLKAIKMIQKNFPDADTGILDIHHAKKLDAPSGTAKLVFDEISKISNKKPRISSFRLGQHGAYLEVYIQNNTELLKISFSAGSLTEFARGLVAFCL